MDTKFFEDYQKQLAEWQKKFFDAWLESMPGKTVKMPESFEKTLEFQQELVKSYLETQRKTAEMMLETQQQFWDKYFETMQKIPTPQGA
jgi:hypothetical protein